MVPSRIIQPHRSFSDAPARDQICIQRIIDLHPGWEIPDLVSAVYYQEKPDSRDVKTPFGDVRLDVPFPEFRNEYEGQWFRFGSYGTHLMSGVWRSNNPTPAHTNS